MILKKKQELDTAYEKSTDFEQLWSQKTTDFHFKKIRSEKTSKLTE